MRVIGSFLNVVVQPNMEASQRDPGDLRLAVNAILTLDALAGVIFSAMKQTGHERVAAIEGDDKFRDLLAEECRPFRVLRDLAAAYKHGELTHPKPKQPRLLLGPEQVTSIDNHLGLYECGDEIGGELVMIELTGGELLRAAHVIGDSYQLLAPLAAAIDRQLPDLLTQR